MDLKYFAKHRIDRGRVQLPATYIKELENEYPNLDELTLYLRPTRNFYGIEGILVATQFLGPEHLRAITEEKKLNEKNKLHLSDPLRNATNIEFEKDDVYLFGSGDYIFIYNRRNGERVYDRMVDEADRYL